MSLSTAEWIAIGACMGAVVALLVAGLAWWKLQAVRAAQLVLLGGGKQDLVDFAVSLQGRIDSIALLDAGRTGVVLTAIQGRDYARIYVKELDRGRPSVALSPEEQEAVERAMGS